MTREGRDSSEKGRETGPDKDGRLDRLLTVWLVVVAILLVVAVVFLGALFNLVYRTTRNVPDPALMHDPPLPQVVCGEPLVWRRLIIPADPPLFGKDTISAGNLNIAAGDLAGDGADELLAYTPGRGAWLIEIDGTMSHREVEFPDLLQDITWDYDGDGAADLLMEKFTQTTASISVLDLSGTVLAEYEQFMFGLSSGLADLDGDGLDDLVVESFDPSDPEAVVITAADRQPHAIDADLHLPCYGDTDGDGVDEAINLDLFGPGGFSTYGLNGLVAKYPGWDSHQIPSGCADLDCDGVDEVFAGGHGYLNLVTGTYVELSYPYTGGLRGSGLDKGLKALDLDRDGQLELVTVGSEDGPDTAVLVFEPDGACVYYEEMGTHISELYLVRDATDGQYLVVKTHDDLLIYP